MKGLRAIFLIQELKWQGLIITAKGRNAGCDRDTVRGRPKRWSGVAFTDDPRSVGQVRPYSDARAGARAVTAPPRICRRFCDATSLTCCFGSTLSGIRFAAPQRNADWIEPPNCLATAQRLMPTLTAGNARRQRCTEYCLPISMPGPALTKNLPDR